ncbi:MAG: UDP-N-acetylmuramoyl-tripeptide--D-alanyl-D-alanine ligase [Candidatus Omnitrophica bacterium]|nr:UDP-N-acetylmuramoyl-tripeptide--D-alanyl-D-alanine ligase [Candidatus Omnitrophota bacterium]
MFTVNEVLKATGGRLVSGDINTSAQGISIDSRTIKPGEAFIAIKGDNFDGHDFIAQAIQNGAKIIVVDYRLSTIDHRPGVSFVCVKDTTRALGDIASYHRLKYDTPVIIVTGTNGKTTTKEMIAWVLSGKYKVLKNEGTKNNHIGLPMTLLGLRGEHDLVVLEAGTNHPGEIAYLSAIASPNIGIITNIGPGHLEFFKDLKGVFKEKTGLLKYLEAPAIALLNADDALMKKKISGRSAPAAVISFGLKDSGDFLAAKIKNNAGATEFLVNNKSKIKLKTYGRHNVYNALIAIATARLFGMSYNDITRRLSSFEFPPSRFRFIEQDNIKFIDDTYNSNPLSLEQALEALGDIRIKGRKIFMMGDMLELGQEAESFHLQAGKKIIESCDVFITVGELSGKAAQAAGSAGFDRNNIFSCGSSRQAKEVLFERVRVDRDDIVLVKGSRGMRMEEVFLTD